MKKAGGIVALVARIFGVLAAIVTLVIGGAGAAFEAEGADTIVGLGWGGVLFSFLTIVFGAIAMGAKGKMPGILIVLSAGAGAILGGTIVAICMALALVGGVIAIFGTSQQPASGSGT